MRKLSVFNFISMDGYFKGPYEDISWHKHGKEESDYSAEAVRSANILLFGRITYEMMASFWPTPHAIKQDPRTAKGINEAEKIVFSRTLEKTDPGVVDWGNTTIIKDDIAGHIKKLKQTRGKDLTILGSGSIITQFAEQNLIDEYQIMIDPIVLGKGIPMFNGITHNLNLKLTDTRTFKSGTVLLCYKAIKPKG